MKKIFASLVLAVVGTISASAFGFKLVMDNCYTQTIKDGSLVSSDTIPAKSIITVNSDAGWIYFNTANSFYRVKSKTPTSWICEDVAGTAVTVSITRDEYDAYLTVAYNGSTIWGGKLTKEKAIWKPIVKPFGVPKGIRPERVPMYMW